MYNAICFTEECVFTLSGLSGLFVRTVLFPSGVCLSGLLLPRACFIKQVYQISQVYFS